MTAQRFLTAEHGVEELLKATPPLHFDGDNKRRSGKSGGEDSDATLLKTWDLHQKRYP